MQRQIENVVAEGVIGPEPVVEGKAQHGDRACRRCIGIKGAGYLAEGLRMHMRIGDDILQIIERELPVHGRHIRDDDKAGEQQHVQRAQYGRPADPAMIRQYVAYAHADSRGHKKERPAMQAFPVLQ